MPAGAVLCLATQERGEGAPRVASTARVTSADPILLRPNGLKLAARTSSPVGRMAPGRLPLLARLAWLLRWRHALRRVRDVT